MKSNVRNKRIWAACLCLVFALTTAIGLLALPLKLYAESSNSSQVNVLKFKQVAAGSDFAIGLTYDGDLYGWSLLEERKGTHEYATDIYGSTDAEDDTLGHYYPGSPIKIDVTFTYASYNSGGVVSAGQKERPTGGTVIGEEDNDIVRLVATKNTAAFLTKSGLVYTWGSSMDSEPSSKDNGSANLNLLMRREGGDYDQPRIDSRQDSPVTYFAPGMINYTLGDSASGLNTIFPGNESGFGKVSYITASEYNYMVTYASYTTAGYEHLSATKNFIWGQSVYNQTTQESLGWHSFHNSDEQQLVNNNIHEGERAYLGDGNVYYIADNDIFVKGKNYAVPSGTVNEDGDGLDGVYNTLMTPDDYDISNDTDEEIKTLAGYLFYEDESDPNIKIPGSVIGKFVALAKDSSTNIKLATNTSTAQFLYSTALESVKTEYELFSASNGFGYIINNGSVLFWGDNTLGQDGTGNKTGAGKTAVSQLREYSSAVQAIAGKVITGKPILESFNNRLDNGLEAALPNNDKWDGGTLKSEYTDGNTYISAVLDSSGSVYAFGANNGTIVSRSGVDFSDYGVGVGKEHKIVYLAGGYGNNLFAISNYGKVFRLQFDSTNKIVVTDAYDEFYYSNGAPIDNWTIEQFAKNSNAKVSFTTTVSNLSENSKGYYAQNAEYYNEETHTDWAANSATVSLGTVVQNAVANPGDQTTVASKNAIVYNNVGDAVRMLIPSFGKTYSEFSVKKYRMDSDGAVAYDGTAMTSYGDKNAKSPYGDLIEKLALKFYWSNGVDSEHELDPEIAFRYVDIEYRYKVGGEGLVSQIDFVITPKRSTGNQSLIIKYPIGRYDSEINFDQASENGNPIFYAVEYATVEVNIANTPLTAEFSTTFSAEEDSSVLPTVPLLDPNNPYNNKYSIAVMDVSTGFEKLLDEFKNITDISFEVKGIADIYKLIAAEDAGFPVDTKIAKGNLEYYNKYAKEYYNNTYKFFTSDVDGDSVKFVNITNINSVTDLVSSVKENNADVFKYRPVEITIELPFTFNGLSEDGDLSDEQKAEIAAKKAAIVDGIKNRFMATDKNVGVATFDNLYGLDISVSDSVVSVKYTVLEIEACRSMNDSYVGYNSDGDVSAPVLKISEDESYRNKLNMLRPSFNDGNTRTSTGASIDVNTQLNNDVKDSHRAIEIFTQASLIFDSSVVEGKFINGIGSEFNTAGSGSVNAYELTFGNKVLSVDGRDISFSLADYFNVTDNIELSYNMKVGEDARNEFVSSFNGATDATGNMSALKITQCTSTSFRGELRRVVSNYKFSVYIRRVLPGNKTFTYEGKEAEVATVNFTVSLIFREYDKGNFAVKSPADAKNPETVSADSGSENPEYRFDIYNMRLNVADTVYRYCTIEVASSNENIVRASWSESDRNHISLVPVTSGTAYIKYYVKLFGEDEYVIEDSFPVNVVMLVTAPSVSLRGTVQVQLSDLQNELRRAGVTDDLVIDTSNSPYQQYCKTEDYAANPDNNDIWSDYSDGDKIPFLANLFVSDDETYVGLTMGTYSSVSEDEYLYRIVVEFLDKATSRTRYKVAFHVTPSEQVLSEANRRDLTVEINKSEKTIVISSSDNATNAGLTYQSDKDRYAVTVDFLKSYIKDDSNGVEYTVLTAQAMSPDGGTDYNKYVQVLSEVDSTEFYLIPLYPTTHSATNTANIRVALKRTDLNGKNEEVVIVNFALVVSGIRTVLEASEYRTILLASFFGVLALLVIVFFIRMGIYWKKKADQRRIIKKNQTLIKMREKMHNKTEAVSKEKLVKTKLKMEDPKYAKMFTDMRAQKEAQTGISLENSYVANKAERKVKAEKAKKKRGKMSLADLQAELEAKRESVARMQMGDFSDMPVDGVPVDGVPVDGVPIQDVPPVQSVPVEEVPIDGVPVFDPNVGFDGMSPEELDAQFKAAMEGEGVVLDDMNNNGGEN